MSSISHKETIQKIIENNGVYPGDPDVIAEIWQYENLWGGITWKLIYKTNYSGITVDNQRNAMLMSAACIDPQLIWSREGGLTDLGRSL